MLAEHCRLCSGARRGVLIRCNVDECPIKALKDHRFIGSADDLLQTITRKCMYCMCDQRSLVRWCNQEDCLLWPYRDRQAQEQEAANG